MALKNLSTVDLQKELERRQKSGRKLESRRAKLAAELAQLDGELAALGIKPGAAPAAGRRGRGAKGRSRAKNAVSLPDAIASAMDIGAEASPSEMAVLVQKNGYKTTAANFNMMVSNAMAKDERFKRLGRGLYKRVK
jgi:hypothetical protein